MGSLGDWNAFSDPEHGQYWHHGLYGLEEIYSILIPPPALTIEAQKFIELWYLVISRTVLVIFKLYDWSRYACHP